MAFHYYTGSDISEQREPAFWRREPRWPIGTFDGPAKMAKQEIGNGHDKMAMAGAGGKQGRPYQARGYAKNMPKIPMG